MIYLYNNELEKISVIGKDDFREFTTTEELNSQWIVEISYPFSLHEKEAEYIGFKDNNEFKLYKITNTSRSDDFVDINGVHIFFHDLKGKVIRDVRPSNKTALQVATEILKDTKWEVFSTAKGLNSTNFYYISKLDAFYDLLDKWQCEFRFETYFDGDGFVKKIYLEDHISKDYGRWFEYGDKLLTVVAEEDHSNVFTAFIGRGKGEETGDGFSRKIKFDTIHWSITNGDPINKPVGQDYVEIKEATRLYGYPDGQPRVTVVDFDEEDDRENLLRLTYEYAIENSHPKLQLKATAVDDNKVELGEVCAIIRPNLDIRYKTRIFKVKTNRLSNLQEFEFGSKIILSRADRIRAEQKTKEKELQEIESRLEQALKNIDIDFNNEDGCNYDLKAGNKYNLPAGYYSFNKPIDENPTKVVYMGAGKVMIADGKGSDGSWKWKTAINGDGIYGSEIISHSITANKLASDVGQSLDLSSNTSITQRVSSTVENYVKKNKDSFKGDNGKGVLSVTTYYHLNNEPQVPSRPSVDGRPPWTTIPLIPIENMKYVWQYSKTTWTDESTTYSPVTLLSSQGSQGPKGNTGDRGPQGSQGPKGDPAISYSSTPPSNTSQLWYNTTDNKLMAYSSTSNEWVETGEELKKNLNNLKQELRSYQELTSQEIKNVVKSDTFLNFKDEAKQLISSNSLKITQSNSNYRQEFERIQGELQNNQISLGKLTGVIESGLDEKGNTYTDWTSKDDKGTKNKNKVRVSSDGITLFSNNKQTMRLKDGEVNTTSIYVKEKLGTGNHIIQRYKDEYSIWSWIGDLNNG